eukprot:XP_001610016.1 hypothetical protein [Babesia bovis T2Bo]
MVEINSDTTEKETVLKGHRIQLRKRSDIAKEIKQLKSQSRIKRDSKAIVSLNVFLKKSVQRDRDIKRTKALEKKPKVYAKQPYNLLFVIRNKRSVESTALRSTLRVMGLWHYGSGRFFSNSESSLRDLDLVKPFVFYGTPTLKNVRNLLHKRGTVRLDNGADTLISGNSVVEDHLGDTGLLCVADVVDAIYKGTDIAENTLKKLGSLSMPSSILEGTEILDRK